MGGAAVGLVVVVIVLLLIVSAAGADDEQPIAFSHNKHAENGIQCQSPHRGVYQSPGGIPAPEVPGGPLHSYRPQKIYKLAEYWALQEPIPVRVNQQPSYATSNHVAYCRSGVAPVMDVANMTVAEPVVNMNMGFA
jgi:hypothetical protein